MLLDPAPFEGLDFLLALKLDDTMSSHMRRSENESETRSVTEKIQSGLRLAVAKLTLELLSRFDIKMDISPESLENLQKIDEYLKHGSIIIYANHTSMLDAFLGIPVGISHLPHLRKAMYLLAEKYAIPNRRKKSSYAIAPLTQLVNTLGVVVVPVPQKLSEQGDEKKKIKGKKRLQKFVEKRNKIMNSSGTAIGFTPEATRDQTIEMTQFKDGIVKTALLYPEALCCPMGLVPKGGNTFELVVGEPKLASQMTESIVDRIALETDPALVKQLLQECADQFGYEVAPLLPENMRGVYGTTVEGVQESE